MTRQPKIIALAGSMRKDSFNKKLIKIATDAAKEAGATVTLIDLNDFPLPLYHGDAEAENGLPENAKRLKKLFMEQDGLLISSPEYNSSVSGVLKNAIDWISRPEKEDPFYLCAYKGKMAALMSASPGALGGLRGLVPLRALLENMGTHVLPDQVTVATADQAFDTAGRLKDPKKEAAVKNLAKQLTDLLRKIL